jgi:tetratricopeptide (TPR) repeat protein
MCGERIVVESQRKAKVSMEQQPIEVFFSYSREDKPLRDKLEIHLSSLRRQGVISSWHDRQIVAGSEWEEEIDRHMRTADILLLLISPDFVASRYCYEIELPDAMARHEAGEAYVVPILLRPTAGWKNLPFAKLQVYPSGGVPITRWGDEDEAFVDVADGIETAVEKLLEERKKRRTQEQEERTNRVREEKETNQYLENMKKRPYVGLFGEVYDDAYFEASALYMKGEIEKGSPAANLQAAITSYSQAIKLKPNYWQAYVGRGEAYSRLRSYESAIADYEQAIEFAPYNYEAFYDRGLVFQILGERQKAIKDFQKAAELCEKQGDLNEKTGNVVRFNRYKDALIRLEKLQF